MMCVVLKKIAYETSIFTARYKLFKKAETFECLLVILMQFNDDADVDTDTDNRPMIPSSDLDFLCNDIDVDVSIGHKIFTNHISWPTYSTRSLDQAHDRTDNPFNCED